MSNYLRERLGNRRYWRIRDYETAPEWKRFWEMGFHDAESGEFGPPTLMPDDPHPYNAYLQGWNAGLDYRRFLTDFKAGRS